MLISLHQIMFSALTLLFINLLQSLTVADDWSYGGSTGPANWYKKYPKCEGTKQSPIDIQTADAEYLSNLGVIAFNGYDTADSTGAKFDIMNNGHTVQVSFTSSASSDLSISGGSLDGVYNLAQFHFHWGSDNSKGCEHTVNGKQCALEIHFVHYSDQYKSLSDASVKPNGLAVVGVLVEASDEANDGFSDILAQLQSVQNKGSKGSLKAFDLTRLLPEGRGFYRYEGSLTTPPCYETVIWSVLKTPILIGESQLSKFRQLKESANVALVDNYRPVQSLSGRTVFSSESYAKQIHARTILILGLVVLTWKTSNFVN